MDSGNLPSTESLRAEDVASDRMNYFCPHCGEIGGMPSDMKQAVLDLTARKPT